jgi:hypothetical protein
MLPDGAPERTVFTRLTICDGLAGAREALQHTLPELAQVPQDWIQEGLVVLRRWHDRLNRAAATPSRPLSLADSWEIPELLVANPAVAVQDVQHAMSVFNGVLEGQQVAAWNMLLPRVELACRAALFVVIMNSLGEDLALAYCAWRQLPHGGPALPEAVLGPNWPDPHTWPNPAAVRQIVRDLAGPPPGP